MLRGLFIFVLFALNASCIGTIRGEKGATTTLSQNDLLTSSILLKRPNYRSDFNDLNKLIVDASENQSAKVVVSSSILINRHPVYLNLLASGRGGLDETPAKANQLYYLYAIQSGQEAALEFELIASVFSPRSGPKGFENWSYLGAFLTNKDAQLFATISTNGFVNMDGEVPYVESELEEKVLRSLPIPESATSVRGKMKITQINVAGVASQVSSTLDSFQSSASLTYTPLEKIDPNAEVRGDLTLPLAKSIFLKAGSKLEEGKSSITINPTRFLVLGWQEDPAIWK